MSTPRDLEAWLDDFRAHLLALDRRRVREGGIPPRRRGRSHTRVSDHRGVSHRRDALVARAPLPRDVVVARAPDPLREQVVVAAAPAPTLLREAPPEIRDLPAPDPRDLGGVPLDPDGAAGELLETPLALRDLPAPDDLRERPAPVELREAPAPTELRELPAPPEELPWVEPGPWDEPVRTITVPAPTPRKPARSVSFRPRPRPDQDPGAGGWLASVGLFLLLWAAYGVLGWQVVVQQHVVPFDALARMAHAYLVWHDDPAKLTAIGFVWPPLQTFAYLPFTVARGGATSLIALPLSTAFLAAGTVTILGRTLRILGVGAGWRLALLVVFALNPLFVFYAVNGMAEMLTLFVLAGFCHFVLRYLQSGHHGWLLPAGALAGLLVLTRYETLLYVAVAAVGVALLLRHRKARTIEAEGTLVGYLAPTVYCLGIWILFNWLLVGDPFGWLTKAGGQSIGAKPADGAPWSLALDTAEVASRISLLAPLAVVGLVAVLAWRRSGRAGLVAVLVLLNAAITLLLFAREAGVELLQPRYNMRVLPVALGGVGWVAWELGKGHARTLWLAGAVALGAFSIPITWHLMEHYPRQYQESAFVQAIKTGDDQEGTESVEGYPIGLRGERQMADWIKANVRGEHAILTDDSLTLGVILLTDAPGRFRDRIQRGDSYWKAVLDDPRGRVDYVLVTTPQGCRPQPPFCNDLVRDRWPQLLDGKLPWAKLVHRTDTNALYRVVEGTGLDPVP